MLRHTHKLEIPKEALKKPSCVSFGFPQSSSVQMDLPWAEEMTPACLLSHPAQRRAGRAAPPGFVS